jgi:hypothetical protein
LYHRATLVQAEDCTNQNASSSGWCSEVASWYFQAADTWLAEMMTDWLGGGDPTDKFKKLRKDNNNNN